MRGHLKVIVLRFSIKGKGFSSVIASGIGAHLLKAMSRVGSHIGGRVDSAQVCDLAKQSVLCFPLGFLTLWIDQTCSMGLSQMASGMLIDDSGLKKFIPSAESLGS